MSRHESQSPSPRAATSPGTAADSSSREPVAEHVSPPPGVLELQSPVVAKCSEWVEKYKAGTIQKGEASYEIHSLLTASGERSDVIKAAVESYITILDQHDVKMAAAFKRGRPKSGRARSHSATSGSSGSNTGSPSRSPSADSRAALRKKKKVDKSDLPWVVRNELFGSELRPELRATLELLKAWSVNPKQVKSSIVNTPKCPAFPDSEWLNLVQGRPINLDNVFSGFYSTSTDNQRTESVGEIELKFGSKDASKPVTTHGDWTIAFDLTRDAYLFTFAHRAEELKQYQRYILQQFATKRESEHPRVIALDRAIRKRVSERRDLLLSDFDQFGDLQTMHLDHYGAANQGRDSETITPKDKPTIKKRTEPCRNWNRGVCGRGKNCFYLHVCAICLQRGHTSDKCPRKGASGSSGSQGNAAVLGSQPDVVRS
jgi:hypothetical protein